MSGSHGSFAWHTSLSIDMAAAAAFYRGVVGWDAQDAGGQVLNGPRQVPGGIWIVQRLDPQSAMFALAGPRR